MESRVDQVLARHHKGYNCAQSVACTYCDLAGVDEALVLKAVEALGRGVGGREGTCGAITGAAVIAGLLHADGNTDAPNSKEDTYKYINEIIARFQASNGSTICKELTGIGAEKTTNKTCAELIVEGAQLLEAVLFAE